MRSVFRYLRNTDLYLLFLALMCSGFSLALVYSTNFASGSLTRFKVQLGAILLGVVCFIFVSIVDLESMARYWKLFYLLNIL